MSFMKKYFVYIVLLLVFITSHADEWRTPLKSTVDVNEFNLSPLVIRKSLLKSVIDNNWQIKKQTKNNILAKYRDEEVNINIENNIVSIIEVVRNKYDDETYFQMSWLKSLKFHFVRNLNYQHHLNDATELFKK